MSIAVLKIMIIFASLSLTDRAKVSPETTGFFIAHKISGVTPPSVSYNGLQSPVEGLNSGKGNTVFLLPVLKFTTMLKNSTAGIPSTIAIKAMHQVNRPELIQKLLFKSKDQLIQKLLIELTAKNRAYYFILEQGYFEQFKEYCGRGDNG